MQTAVAPRLITFDTEEQLHDHAERLNQIGVSPDVPIMDARGQAVLAEADTRLPTRHSPYRARFTQRGPLLGIPFCNPERRIRVSDPLTC